MTSNEKITVDAPTRAKKWVLDTIKQLLLPVFLVLLVRSSLIEPYRIPSGSMIPTLFIGDFIFVNKFSYGFKVPFSDNLLEKPIFVNGHSAPNRGDVIVFKYPKDESLNYIKRVIGLPGDIIAIRNRVLYINNKPMPESPDTNAEMMEGVETDRDKATLSLYQEELEGVKHPVLHDGQAFQNFEFGPITVPAGAVFVMGDNRDRSNDSRFWGTVPLDNIKGRALFVWLSMEIDFGENARFKVRPSRIAKPIR